MVRKLLLALIAVSFLAANTPENPARAKVDKLSADQNVTEISGYYTCKGTEAGGKPYSGICVISKKNDVYLVQWVIGSGSTFLGVGIRQGHSTDIIEASALAFLQCINRALLREQIRLNPQTETVTVS